MRKRRKYWKRADRPVVAVRLQLDTDGFVYHKWGSDQRCKAGDWVVENGEDTYTVDAEVFAKTYRALSPGLYWKVAPVWAEVASAPGHVRTGEGTSSYLAGDYLVSNDEDGMDSYCMSAATFELLYEPDKGRRKQP